MFALEMEALITNHCISVGSDQLPKNAARAEVIAMYQEEQASHELPNIDFSKSSMAEAMRGLEDHPVTYTGADIKERWQ